MKLIILFHSNSKIYTDQNHAKIGSVRRVLERYHTSIIYPLLINVILSKQKENVEFIKFFSISRVPISAAELFNDMWLLDSEYEHYKMTTLAMIVCNTMDGSAGILIETLWVIMG